MNRIYQQIIYGRQRFLLMALLLFFMALFAPKLVGAQGTPLCAEVKIVIEQKLSFERQAFDAKMIISNGLHDADVKDVSIDLLFLDKNEQPVTGTTDPNAVGAKFFYRTDTLKGIGSIDGQGQVVADSAAEIHWLIIPSAGAAANEGSLYYVGAKVTYTLNNVTTTVDVTPDFIVVKPQPQLTLDYFLPTDVYADDAFTDEVEPPVPFTLGVRIKNTGGGAAVKTAIESAQPKIVENKLNLLIDFKILGGYVSDEPAGQSLLLDFGDIAANSSKIGRWNMITTLSGQFVEFNAYYSHADELGGAVTSLLEEVNTHTLVHDVKVDLPGRDHVRDFLALDENVLRVYESDGVDTVVADQSKTLQLNLQGSKILLSYQAAPGFTYVKIPDPFQESRVPVKAVRSDGKVLSSENFWLSKTRNEDGETWIYHINLFDSNTTGSYELFFADNPLATISGLVFDDINGNGILEEGEHGVGVAKITLTGLSVDGNSIVTTGYTDVQGRFGFKQIQPGQYALEVAALEGMVDIVAIAGDAGGIANLNKINGIDLGAGTTAQGYQFAKQWSTVLPPNVKADLSMAIAASTTNPAIGDEVAFVYRIENAGPDQAKQVKTAITWPEGLTNINCQNVAGEQYIDGVWSIDKLDANVLIELNCTAQASDLSVERTIHAVAASQTTDPVTTNNEAFVTLQAIATQAKADVSISIAASTLQPGVGEQVTFVYTAHNAGPDQAKDIQTRINWPNGLTDVSCQTAASERYTGSVWAIGNIAMNASATLTCTAQVVNFHTEFFVQANISSVTPDHVPQNNSYSITLQVASIVTGSTVSGKVYEDLNNNGSQDQNETELQNVTVTLSRLDAGEVKESYTTRTNTNGMFSFTRLEAGLYVLKVSEVQNMVDSSSKAGTAGGIATIGVINNIVLAEDAKAEQYEFAKRIFTSWIDPHNRALSGVVELIDGTQVSTLSNVELTLVGYIGDIKVERTTLTDENGVFRFDNLPLAHYTLAVGFVDGTTNESQTPSYDSPLGIISNIYPEENYQVSGYVFRKRVVTVNDPTKASVSGKVFWDVNGNGKLDAEEPGISGLLVGVTDPQTPWVGQTAFTDNNGNYKMVGLSPNDSWGMPYMFWVGSQYSSFPGIITLGEGGEKVINGYGYIELTAGQNAQEYNFARKAPLNSSSISGAVYLDENENGVIDSNEFGLGGIEVILSGSDGTTGISVVHRKFTDLFGQFSFNDLNNGNYTITISKVRRLLDGQPVVGSAGGTSTVKGRVHGIQLSAGVDAKDYYFTKADFSQGSSITGKIYEDVNGNGIYDAGDRGVENVNVNVSSINTQTDTDGNFEFKGLDLGTYELKVGAVEGLTDSSAVIGGAGGMYIPNGRISSVTLSETQLHGVGYYFAKRQSEGTNQWADLSISTTDYSNGKPQVGKDISLSWTVKNNGPDPVKNAVVDITLPENLTIVTGSSSFVDGKWHIGHLSSQELTSLPLKVRVNSVEDDLTFISSVRSALTDLSMQNNESTLIWVGRNNARTDLSVSFDSISAWLPKVGDTKSLDLTAKNNGPDTAYNVVVWINIPGNLSYVRHSAASGTQYSVGKWTIDELPPGGTKKLGLNVKVNQLNDDTNILTQIVNTHGIDLVSSNNVSSIFWKGRNNHVSDLSVVMRNYGGSAINKDILFEVSVPNAGPDIAYNTIVSLSLPPSVSLIKIPSNCSFIGLNGACTINEQGASFPGRLSFTIRTNTFAGSPTIYSSVRSQGKDPNSANNNAAFILK